MVFIAFFFDVLVRVGVGDLVFAIDTLAGLCACHACVETFAVFFLALGFFTDASITGFSRSFAFYLCFGLFYELRVLVSVTTAVANTIWSTLLARRKTFAIVFQTVSFSACAPISLSLEIRSLDSRLLINIDFLS